MATIKGITIEIGGDTQKLNKALEGVNKKSKDLQGELKQVDRLLKLDPKNTELLAQKQKLLTDAVGNTKEKLDTLKEAEKQVQQQFEKGEVGEEQYRAIQREVVATEQNLKKLEDSLQATNNKWKDMGERLGDIGSKTKAVGEKVSGVGVSMSKGLTAPIVGIGAASMAAFNEVDAGLDTIVTKTGASGEALDSMGDSFKKVYGSMPVDAQAVGDAIGEVNTQFGLMGEELESTTELALKFSEINGQDVTSSIIDSKGAMEAYGLSAQDIPSILDAVTTTAQGTGVATDKLFDSVTKGAPQLKSMGLDFAESTQLMGLFEQKGIDSSKALSYLSKAQVTWAKDGKSMTDGLAELTKNIESATTKEEALTLASEAFGTKGASFMLDALDRGALSMDGLAGASEKAGGAVTNTFEGTLDPIDDTKVAMNNLKTVGAELSEIMQGALAEALKDIVKGLQGFSEWFGKLNPETQEMIVKVGMLLAVLGPIVLIVGKIITIGGTLISGIGAVVGAFSAGGAAATALGAAFTILTGPVGLIVAAIAGVVAIGVALYKNWDTIKEKAGQLGDWLGEKWGNIKEKTTEVWGNVKETMGEAMSVAKEKVTERLSSMKQAFDENGGGIKGIVAGLNKGIKDNFTENFKAVDKLTGGKLSEIKDKFKTSMGAIKDNVSDRLGKMKQAFNDNGGGIKGIVAGLTTGIKDNFTTTMSSIDTLTGGKLTSIKKAFTDKMGDARDAVKSAIDKIKGFFNFNWELPKLKMPKFSITGEFSLNPPKVPKFGISWHKEGAIFTKPTLFNTSSGMHGVGEAGAEAVLPIEKLDGIIASALQKAGGSNGNITIQNVVTLDGRIVAQAVNKVNSRNDRRFNPTR